MRSLLTIAACAALGFQSPCFAQDESIHPGVNERFENRDLEHWISTFEAEDREVYTRQDEIVAALDLEPGMEVADIGAGTGFFTMLFADKVGPEGTVYAVDITETFVRHVAQTAKELGLHNVEPIVNPTDSTNLEQNSIDVAFICVTYHHFEYPFKMLASIREALRPEGIVVLVELERRIEGVSEELVLSMVRAGKGTFTDEFKDAGFELVEEVPFNETNYILKFTERE